MRPFHFIIFFLFIIPTIINAQAYQPMAIENAHWVIYNGIEYDLNPHIFVVRGDTTIANKGYKKIYFQDLVNDINWADPFYQLEGEFLWGAIRDDTLTRQVYVIAFEPYDPGQVTDLSYQCSLFEEQLIYDFSAVVGDTIAKCLGQNDPGNGYLNGWVIESISSEFIYGEDRRTFYSSNEFHVPAIYEGIGSHHGLLGGIQQPIFPGTAISGYYLFDYCIGTDEECLIISNNQDIVLTKNKFQLYPNPTESDIHLNITPAYSEILKFEVYNIYGQRIFKTIIPKNQSDLSISIQHLPMGIYNYVLIFNETQTIIDAGTFCKK